MVGEEQEYKERRAGGQRMEKMKRWEKKNGKRQLVWRLEEKLGSDTEESFMHCTLRIVRSDKGLVKHG